MIFIIVSRTNIKYVVLQKKRGFSAFFKLLSDKRKNFFVRAIIPCKV